MVPTNGGDASWLFSEMALEFQANTGEALKTTLLDDFLSPSINARAHALDLVVLCTASGFITARSIANINKNVIFIRVLQK